MKNFISGFSALIFILSSVIVPSASLAQTVSGVEFTNVRAESITASSADILWNTNIEVDTHKVEYGKTSGTYSSIVYSDQNPCLSRITTTSHCISLANLDPSTVYYYRVSVVESGGGGEHISGEYSFATTSTTSSSDNTTGSTPAAPTNLTATITSSGSSSSNIGLTWRDKSDNEEKFIIYRALTGNTLEHSIGHVGTNVTSYTDENGVLGTSYDYAVKACNSNYGCSEFSNMVTILYEDTTTDDITTTEEPASTVARVQGYILDSDGNPLPLDSVGIVFKNSASTTTTTPSALFDGTGYFYRDLETGISYQPIVHVSQDLGYRAPELSTFTLNDSGKDLGTIKLIKYNSTISGTVYDSLGNPLSDIKIGANEINTNNFVSAKTGATGQYTLSVDAGTWDVFVSVSNDEYAPVEPQEVSISSGTLIPSINFELNKVASTLSGHLVNKNGNKVTSVSGRAGLFADDGTMKGGGPIENGEFSFAASEGTYNLYVELEKGSGYVAGPAKPVTVISGLNSITVSVISSDLQISGYIKDEAGSPITGLSVEVGASGPNGAFTHALVDSSTGKYVLNVSSGTWYLGYRADPATGYLSKEPNISVTVLDASVQKNLLLQKANGKVKGKVVNPDGIGVAGLYVAASKNSFKEAAEGGSFDDVAFSHTITKTDGSFTLPLPAGTYYIKAFTSADSEFIAPEEKNVTLNDAENKSISNLKLRTPSIKIKGKVYIENTGAENAFVWAWSETGGYRETKTTSGGSFEFLVAPNENWHVAAGKEVSNTFYKSVEHPVSVGTTDIPLVMYMEKISDLPDSITQTAKTTETTIVQISDGTRVSAPPNFTSESTSVDLSIAPDTRSPSQGAAKVVGHAYNMEARDASGKLITNFDSSVTVRVPYKDTDVLGVGAKEDDLTLGYWDETAGTWKKLDNSVVNKTDKVVTATTKHFTRFAVLTVVPVVDVSHIADGDLITTANSFDVYIAKKVGNKKFKRLILNPEIFESYGHLSWDSIKTVTQAEVDEFILSGLTMEIYSDGTPVNGQVYQVSSAPNSDIGISSKIQMSAQAFEAAGYDWDGIFKINHTEASPNFYPEGDPITA